MRTDRARDVVRGILNANIAAYGKKAMEIDSPEKAKTVLNVWTECLKDLPEYRLKKAARQWIETKRWPPSIAELRELALHREDFPEAELEFINVKSTFGHPERYASLHYITREAIDRAGGYDYIRRANEVESRKAFIQAFNARKAQIERNLLLSDDSRFDDEEEKRLFLEEEVSI